MAPLEGQTARLARASGHPARAQLSVGGGLGRVVRWFPVAPLPPPPIHILRTSASQSRACAVPAADVTEVFARGDLEATRAPGDARLQPGVAAVLLNFVRWFSVASLPSPPTHILRTSASQSRACAVPAADVTEVFARGDLEATRAPGDARLQPGVAAVLLNFVRWFPVAPLPSPPTHILRTSASQSMACAVPAADVTEVFGRGDWRRLGHQETLGCSQEWQQYF